MPLPQNRPAIMACINAAGDIYDAEGKKSARKIWKAFSAEKNKLGDEAFLALLDRFSKAVADMVRNRDKTIIF